MNINELKENETLELKSAENGLPLSFWETYSSFANTEGGIVYLGIKETKNGNVLTNIKNPKQMTESILTTVRNKSKVSLSLINESNIETLNIDGSNVIKIRIPEAPRNEKPVYLNSNISDAYIRIGDGDHKADINEIRSMLVDNSTENYDYLPNKMNHGFDSVNLETLRSFRNKYELVHPRNYYSSLSDEDFLSAIGALIKNKDGLSVLTNGALLMFGNYFKITSVFENYMLDYREARSMEDKWNYRICSDDMNWSGNMYDFYSMVYLRDEPFFPKPFVTKKDQDVGGLPGDEALREILANASSNYSPFLPGGLVILMTGDKLIVRNTGRIKVGLEQAMKGGKTNPRSLQIQTFFRLLGITDKAGTGIPKVFSIAKELSVPAPLLIEKAYPEETTLTFYLVPTKDEKKQMSNIHQQMLEYIASKGGSGITPKEMEEHFPFSRTYINKNLKILEEGGFIRSNDLPTNGRKYFLK